MEIDTLLESFQDFEKKGKKETCPALDQFLCNVAKTGETMISWSQFKSYFLFKLEKVMDDFRASTTEQRGQANPNVDYIPFEEMKERILKIVEGYNGIPFTIQRLCELLTEPKRNYTGTDKFLRGVEKNVMVVSCVYPTSEKNGATSVNRVNGVMFPGNSSVYSNRNVNGPGTPRPLIRPKPSLSTSLATNGLPDSTDNKEPVTEQGEEHVSDSTVSEGEGVQSSSMKNKHPEEEDAMESERHEVKRLKFDKDGEDVDEEENEEEEEEEDEKERESSCSALPESSSDVPESSTDIVEEEKDTKSANVTSDDQEPSSSTQTEPLDREEETAEREVAPGPAHSQKSDSTVDQSEQLAQSGKGLSLEEHEDGEGSDPVSSSSSSSSSGEGMPSDEPVPASPSSTAESSTEGVPENSAESPETADEPMNQD